MSYYTSNGIYISKLKSKTAQRFVYFFGVATVHNLITRINNKKKIKEFLRFYRWKLKYCTSSWLSGSIEQLLHQIFWTGTELNKKENLIFKWIYKQIKIKDRYQLLWGWPLLWVGYYIIGNLVFKFQNQQ